MKAETYQELKTRTGKEIADFPMAFAFSAKQLEEALAKLEATKDEVVSIGSGGIVRKTDSAAFVAMFERHESERIAAFKHDSTLIEAICYELGNHEYSYTGDPSDALDALGITLDDKRTAKCFKFARDKYLAACEDY